MDLILRYPNPETAFVGFFMVDADLQGKGTGSQIIKAVELTLKSEFSFIRLAYVEGNRQSEHFWHKNGFAPTGIITAVETYRCVVLQKTL